MKTIKKIQILFLAALFSCVGTTSYAMEQQNADPMNHLEQLVQQDEQDHQGIQKVICTLRRWKRVFGAGFALAVGCGGYMFLQRVLLAQEAGILHGETGTALNLLQAYFNGTN